MISWNQFDKIMIEFEQRSRKKSLPGNVIRTLKQAKCWRGNEPYCSWTRFTYELTIDQIEGIQRVYQSMKEQA